MSRTALITIAQGTEEIEAIVPADLLRRANFHVKIAGDNEIVTCSRGVKIIPDLLIEKLNSDVEYDIIILPGGRTGTLNLLNDEKLIKLLRKHYERGGWIAAICAAPSILVHHKIMPKGSPITSHPSVKEMLADYEYREEKVVVHERFITSRGVGTSIDFALKIIELLMDKTTAEKIAKDIVY
jgi:DJ-1 family protein